MKALAGLVLAVVVALIGAALYATVQFKLGLVGGLIAYPLGWGVGRCILFAAGGTPSPVPGGESGAPLLGPLAGPIAVAIALAGMVMAKVFVVWFAQASGWVIDDVGAAIKNEFDALDVLWFAIAAWPAWSVARGRDG